MKYFLSWNIPHQILFKVVQKQGGNMNPFGMYFI